MVNAWAWRNITGARDLLGLHRAISGSFLESYIISFRVVACPSIGNFTVLVLYTKGHSIRVRCLERVFLEIEPQKSINSRNHLTLRTITWRSTPGFSFLSRPTAIVIYMADLPAILARDFCADNPFLVISVKMGLVHRIVISIPNVELAQCNKQCFLQASCTWCRLFLTCQVSTVIISALNSRQQDIRRPSINIPLQRLLLGLWISLPPFATSQVVCFYRTRPTGEEPEQMC